MRIVARLIATTIVLGISLTAAAANRVEIMSTGAPSWPCFQPEVRVKIQNDIDLESFSLPLVVRSLYGGAFWAPPLDTLASTGRLSTSLTGVRSFETGRVDFDSPDQILFYFKASDPSDCLPAGSSEVMTGLICKTVPFNAESEIEIDTLSYAPCFQPMFFRCTDGAPVSIDEFVKGSIYVHYIPFDYCLAEVSFDSTSLTAWAGASLENRVRILDPMGDQHQFRQTQGPGSLDSVTGLWTWKSPPADTGVYTVSIWNHSMACPEIETP
jgi:hypothetical protein